LTCNATVPLKHAPSVPPPLPLLRACPETHLEIRLRPCQPMTHTPAQPRPQCPPNHPAAASSPGAGRRTVGPLRPARGTPAPITSSRPQQITPARPPDLPEPALVRRPPFRRGGLQVRPPHPLALFYNLAHVAPLYPLVKATFRRTGPRPGRFAPAPPQRPGRGLLWRSVVAAEKTSLATPSRHESKMCAYRLRPVSLLAGPLPVKQTLHRPDPPATTKTGLGLDWRG